MEYRKIVLDLNEIPEVFRNLAAGCTVYDCSCSNTAVMYYLNRGEGLYLKKAAKGALEKEALMTKWFAEQKMAAPVEMYLSDENDWLLKQSVNGKDMTDQMYLEKPEKLAEVYASVLRNLHEMDPSGCPEQHYKQVYQNCIEKDYRKIKENGLPFEENRFSGWDEAKRYVDENLPYLNEDVVIHGDYCLPNVIMKDWDFAGFIDLGNSGVFDRHVDIYWALWSMEYNLKTDRYGEVFLEAYGRDKVDKEALRVVEACEYFG